MEKFRGNYKYSLDSKGRFMLPNDLKKIVLENNVHDFVVLPGFSNEYRYIFVLPYIFSQKIENKLDNLRFFDTKAQKIYTYFFGNSFKITLDNQGRLRLPQKIIDNLGINQEVIITGEGDFIKLWHPEDFNQMMQKEMSFKDNALNDLLKYINEKYDI